MNEETIRAAFEKFMSDDGKWPQAIERDGAGNYILSQSASSWHVWRNAYHQCQQSPEIQALREDAELYRWIKENIKEGYEFDGGYYISDTDTKSWDSTIRAAMEQQHD